MPNIHEIIIRAISERRMLRFDYDAYQRVVEPHVYGIKNEKSQILGYQTEGSSHSGGLPEWRRFDTSGISNLESLDTTFAGSRPFPSGEHSTWDQTFAIVT